MLAQLLAGWHAIGPMLALASLAAGPALAAQAPQAGRPADPAHAVQRVGIVLSGGSAKGLAHIGVLRVLEEAGLPIDLITGTSMGALVGGLYAVGYTPSGLARIVTSLDFKSIFQDAFDPRFLGLERRVAASRTLLTLPVHHGRPALPGGLIAGQRISELLARLTWPVQTVRDFRQLRTPFTAVATDVENGQVVALDSGSLAAALRASMSLPSIFQPVEIDGRLLVDGGVVRNLPAKEARERGATVVICSDVTGGLADAAKLRSFIDVVSQTVAFQMTASTAEQRRLCDIHIQPDTRGLSSDAYNRAAEWIGRGEAAARAALPKLRQIVASEREGPHTVRPGYDALVGDTVRVRRVEVRGLPARGERLARLTLRLRDGAVVTPDTMERAVQRVYATGLYGRVTYQLERVDSGTVAVILPLPREDDHVGFGVRYDNQYNASLLFTATLLNRLRYGSRTLIELRLGNQIRAAGHFVRGSTLNTRLLLGTGVAYTRSPLAFFVGSRRVAEARVQALNVTGFAGAPIGVANIVGVQLKAERARAESFIAPNDSSLNRSYGTVAGVFFRNRLDRPDFPTRGGAVFAKSEWMLGRAPFSHHVLQASAAVPLPGPLTLLARATAGVARGENDVPAHYRFYLGGPYPSAVLPEALIPAFGLKPQERWGYAVQRVEGAVRWEMRERIFATVRADAARVEEKFEWKLDDAVRGVAASLGTLTLFGPVELTATWRGVTESPRFAFTVGYVF
jgi:NTE family protein